MEQMAAENNWTELQMTTNVRPFWTADRVSQILAIFEIWCVEVCKLRHLVMEFNKKKSKIQNLKFSKLYSIVFPHNFFKKHIFKPILTDLE